MQVKPQFCAQDEEFFSSQGVLLIVDNMQLPSEIYFSRLNSLYMRNQP